MVKEPLARALTAELRTAESTAKTREPEATNAMIWSTVRLLAVIVSVLLPAIGKAGVRRAGFGIA